jgi:hypothetical protein
VVRRVCGRARAGALSRAAGARPGLVAARSSPPTSQSSGDDRTAWQKPTRSWSRSDLVVALGSRGRARISWSRTYGLDHLPPLIPPCTQSDRAAAHSEQPLRRRRSLQASLPIMLERFPPLRNMYLEKALAYLAGYSTKCFLVSQDLTNSRPVARTRTASVPTATFAPHPQDRRLGHAREEEDEPDPASAKTSRRRSRGARPRSGHSRRARACRSDEALLAPPSCPHGRELDSAGFAHRRTRASRSSGETCGETERAAAFKADQDSRRPHSMLGRRRPTTGGSGVPYMSATKSPPMKLAPRSTTQRIELPLASRQTSKRARSMAALT